jgi:hypothetical protein
LLNWPYPGGDVVEVVAADGRISTASPRPREARLRHPARSHTTSISDGSAPSRSNVSTSRGGNTDSSSSRLSVTSIRVSRLRPP